MGLELKDLARAGAPIGSYSGITGSGAYSAGQVISIMEFENAAFSKNGEGGIITNAKMRRSCYAASVAAWKVRLLLFTKDVSSDTGIVAGSAYNESGFQAPAEGEGFFFGSYLFDNSETDKSWSFASSDGDFNHVETVEAKNPSLNSFVCPVKQKSIWGVLIAVDSFAYTNNEVHFFHLDVSR